MTDDHTFLSPVSRNRAKVIADLERSAGRKEHGLFRIEGWRALQSALDAGADLAEVVVRSDALDAARLTLLKSLKTQVCTVGSKGMSRLTSVLQDQGVVATAKIRNDTIDDLVPAKRLLGLNGVQDPGNVGTLIRTAAWFGVEGVVADAGTADFYNPKVVRAAAGALWDVHLVRADSLVEPIASLKTAGFSCYGTDVGSAEDSRWREMDRCVLVLGSEGHGMQEEIRALMDGFVHVTRPASRSRGVESLNVATAGSILIARWVSG